MRKGAFLLALLIAVSSPGLALAKKARRAAAKPPAQTAQNFDTLNASTIRLWNDLVNAPYYMATQTTPSRRR